MTAIDIINYWYFFSGYDPDQHKFNLLSSEYTFHRANERIGKIFEYDPSGAMAVIYAKTVFRAEMEKATVKLLPLLESPDTYAGYRKMLEMFYSKDMAAIENVLLDRLWNTSQMISGKTAIGERDLEAERNVLTNSVCAVIEQLEKLKIDSYQRGAKLGDNLLQNVSPQIHVFPTLAQCVLTLEKAKDGLYLCFIRNGDTADGYFGFFIKSNGNIISLNERPDEAFIGQHANARNARWTDGKAYDIFPYGIFSFEEHDYKGYATVHKINDTKLSFVDMAAENYFPAVLAIVLIAQKYAGQENVGKSVFIDSLLPGNFEMAQLAAEKSGALIPYKAENSLIIAENAGFELGFNEADVVSGKPNASFHHVRKDVPHDETGTFPEQTGYAQMLIDLYGDGFKLNAEALLRSDSALRMLPVAGEKTKEQPNVEFVGTKGRLQKEAYRRARAQLAAHIRNKMVEEYAAFGGVKAVMKWWHDAMASRKDFIEELCVKLYLQNNIEARMEQNPKDRKETYDEWGFLLKNDSNMSACYYPDTKGKASYSKLGSWHHVCPENMPYNEPGMEYRWRCVQPDGTFFCPETGNKASVYFVFNPENWKELMFFTGQQQVPKIVTGWKAHACRGVGNNLLGATDMVWSVETPLETVCDRDCDDKRRYLELELGTGHDVDFCIGIAWSKRGWKKVLEKYKGKVGKSVESERAKAES